MKLPAGTEGRVIINPQKEGMLQSLMAFTGAIEIDSGQGRGFLLTRNGELVAAYFKNPQGVYRGITAVQHLMGAPDAGIGIPQQNFIMRAYGSKDFAEALDLCTQGGLLIEKEAEPERTDGDILEMPPDTPRQSSPSLDEATLTKIATQSGVIAVSAFYEGFPVRSLGEEDFEHVAARAEDFMRAGTQIAADMHLGQPDQLILETAERKIIIAPCGDLFICIIARADVQLGLLRVLLKSLQSNGENLV